MKRLESILSLIDSQTGVADIGTDHGIIPVSLALSGYRGNLIATDIHELPLKSARLHAEAAGVSEKIRFLLTDGLDGINPSEVDSIVIAGLGGDVICSILDRAEWTMSRGCQMILQPMTKGEILRFWLCNNGYAITSEHLAEENGRLFQILSVSFTGENTLMADAELYLGKPELIQEKARFGRMLGQVISRMQKKCDGLTRARDREADFFLQILKELLNLQQKDRKKGDT